MNRINAARAWSALAAAVIAYEVLAPEGQLLSEGVDRALLKYPRLTRIGIALVACHLVNAIPDRYDPIHHVAVQARRRHLRVVVTR